ncbi:MAG: type II/IV secretion system ATPase subunit [archaeon]
MTYPSFKLMLELEKKVQKLKETEKKRLQASKLAVDLEKKLLTKKLSEKEFRKEYRKLLTEKNTLKQLKTIDNEIINDFLGLASNFNSLTDSVGLHSFPFTRYHKASALSNLKFNLKDSLKKVSNIKVRKPVKLKKEQIKQIIEIPKETKKEIVLQKPVTEVDFGEESLSTLVKDYVREQLHDLFPSMFNKPEALDESLFESTAEQVEKSFKPMGEYLTLVPEFAFAQVEETREGKKYFVYEPLLSDTEAKQLSFLKDRFIEEVALGTVGKGKLFTRLSKILVKNKLTLSDEQKEKFVYFLSRDLYGVNKVEPLMHDPLIEDIECDGTNIPLFIVHRKYGNLQTNVSFDSIEELQDFIIKLSQLCKSYVSFASPLLDAVLPDGSRVNAVLTESISTSGPTFTIRKFPETPFSPIDLVLFKMLNTEILAYLWLAIEFKRSILIIGPTASGKTTLLNVLGMLIPAAQRIVSIEDTREINLVHDNWLPQVSRPGFGPPDVSGRKYGEVSLIDLIKESFRQRPDYLIVGEVRGDETYVMFQGMSAGHTCFSTIHAKSVDDVVNRLITPPINLSPTLLNSLDLIIALGFSGVSSIERRIRAINEVKGFNIETQKLETNKLFEWNPAMEKQPVTEISVTGQGETIGTDFLPITYRSLVLKTISAEYGISHQRILEVIQSRKQFLDGLIKDPPKTFIEFKEDLNSYKKKEKLI